MRSIPFGVLARKLKAHFGAHRQRSKWSFFWRVSLESFLLSMGLAAALDLLFEIPDRGDLGKVGMRQLFAIVVMGPLLETALLQSLPVMLVRSLGGGFQGQFLAAWIPFALLHFYTAGVGTGIKKPGVCNDLIDFTDFLPTVCEAAGATVPEELKIDGRSFLPQLSGGAANPREWTYCWFSKDGKSTPSEYARNLRYKLYRTGAFYDVVADVLEKQPLTELSAEAKQARDMLQQVLDRYRDARLTALPTKNKNLQSAHRN